MFECFDARGRGQNFCAQDPSVGEGGNNVVGDFLGLLGGYVLNRHNF